MTDDLALATQIISTELNEWRQLHGIDENAWRDLMMLLAPPIQPYTMPELNTEAYNQQMLRLVASSREHTYLWRNNVGAYVEPGSRRQIRYGLCNDSKKLNAKWKSSDLIGGTPILVTPQHVGMRLLVFTAVEVKAGGWKPGKDRMRERAQLRFINAVRTAGGIGFFCNDARQYNGFLDQHGVPLVRKSNGKSVKLKFDVGRG